MADAHIRAVITAEDRGSAVVAGFGNKLNQSFLQIAAITAAASIALERFTGFLGGTLDAANKNQAALTGLSSVARAFHQNIDEATNAARSLARDGLMTVTDAALGLKNLLAAGFSLPQAVKLMERFKDSAAFGRQSALSFGQAITSATEGIKNGNSILVDNAGVTKNLSVILEEAGFSAQDLMRATTDANVRMALFNGIIRETNPQLGDAARLAEQFAGKQAMASAQTTILQQQIGTALQAALLPFLQAITPIIIGLANWVEHHQRLAAAISIGIVILLGMVAILGVIAGAVAAVTAAIGAFGAVVVGVALAAAGALAAAAAAVIVNWDRVRAFFGGLPGFIQSALAAVPGIIVRAFLGPLGPVLDTLNRIGEKFRSIPGMNALSSAIGKIPGFASGVENFGGGLAIVGEQGPELVHLPGGSSVTPNNRLGTTVNMNVNVGLYAGTEMEKRRIAKELFRAYEDLMGAQGVAA